MKSWAKIHHNGVLMNLYIQPGAALNIEFLSEVLNVSKSKLHLLRGESSRQKDILVELPLEEVLIWLQVLLK